MISFQGFFLVGKRHFFSAFLGVLGGVSLCRRPMPDGNILFHVSLDLSTSGPRYHHQDDAEFQDGDQDFFSREITWHDP